MKSFFRYTLISGITFLISYSLIVVSVDVLDYPAFLTVPIISVFIHIIRYNFIYKKGNSI